MQAVLRIAKLGVIDALGLAGAAAVSYGAWLAWAPAGFIVGGILAVGVSILWARA